MRHHTYKNIILSKISQTEKATYYTIPFIWNFWESQSHSYSTHSQQLAGGWEQGLATSNSWEERMGVFLK
jgi:hypothetical protein